jgi:hypothetical protein
MISTLPGVRAGWRSKRKQASSTRRCRGLKRSYVQCINWECPRLPFNALFLSHVEGGAAQEEIVAVISISDASNRAAERAEAHVLFFFLGLVSFLLRQLLLQK